MKTRRFMRCVSLLFSLLLMTTSVSAAAAPDTQAATLAQILNELRELQRTVELATLTHVKVQVATARLSVREQHMQALRQQADHIEQSMAANAVDLERSRNELAQLESKIAEETEPDARQELTAQRSALTDSITQMSAQEQDNQQRAATIAGNLATEKAEIERLLQELVALEKDLEDQGAGFRPQPASAPVQPVVPVLGRLGTVEPIDFAPGKGGNPPALGQTN